MLNLREKKAQAAAELAVFGAILIFILGTIVSSAINNRYAQNQNFKAMRIAMLNSWNSSKAGSMARNNSSLLFVEDRLSADIGKYGALDRNPLVANGSGTFTYQLFYPMDISEVGSMLPVLDVYINGQHFPFTSANFFWNVTIPRPSLSQCAAITSSCEQLLCYRNAVEWVGGSTGGTIYVNQFDTVIPVPLNEEANNVASANAISIFNQLVTEGIISNPYINSSWNALTSPDNPSYGSLSLSSVPATSSAWGSFVTWFTGKFPGPDQQAQINQVLSILQANSTAYKLFYSQADNGTPQYYASPGPPNATVALAPSCGSHPCKDQELSTDLVLHGPAGAFDNATGDLLFNLLRRYDVPLSQNTSFVSQASNMRPYMAWQWSATAATSASMLGINTTNNQYPNYDIDGRLKTVTVYSVGKNPDGSPFVSYEDFSAGDIDSQWDSNSCGPKPGLQNNSEIISFAKNGTYLLMREGKMFNPQTGEFVRSANKRDSVDYIQREIQLSNNTGRFCSGTAPLGCVANDCNNFPDPNPVEVCIAPGSSDNCFSSEKNIKSTCLDQNSMMLFVRSRIEDRRGRFWLTDTSGQLQVQ